MTDKPIRHSFVLKAVSLHIAQGEADQRAGRATARCAKQLSKLTKAEDDEYVRMIDALTKEK